VINKYKTYQSFIDITELGGDIDLKFMLTVLDKHGSQILDNIKVLERQLSSARHADVIIMTAHKSKGLEFYSVEVGVDFQPYTSKTSVEEKNLIYVAMTRAMENLKVTNIKF
jgi:ATP-dependent exoDNAse (exonuclease V) beta subunit